MIIITVARREAASWNSILSLQYSEPCELSSFSLQGPLFEQFIIADSAKKVRLHMRNSLFY